jgi:hypothetical protein
MKDAKEQLLNQEAALMSVVVEALLYAAEPSFVLEERNETVYINVLESLIASNPKIFDAIDLSNIQLFLDDSAKESPYISKIIQLLGDKLKVIDVDV